MSTPKYRNTPTIVDGFRFDSKKEAKRWSELRLLESAGKIFALERQPRYPLVVNGMKVCTYVADFRYYEDVPSLAEPVIEDVKGVQTRDFKLKMKLLKAIHGIEVRIT